MQDSALYNITLGLVPVGERADLEGQSWALLSGKPSVVVQLNSIGVLDLQSIMVTAWPGVYTMNVSVSGPKSVSQGVAAVVC